MFDSVCGTVVRAQTHPLKGPLVVLALNALGVNIELFTPPNATCVATGTVLTLYTSLQVKETGLTLFGFLSLAERHAFEQLQQASGVGAKMALALIGTLTMQELVLAINSNNPKVLTQAKGVGLKLAQKIVLEFKDKTERLLPEGTLADAGVNVSPLSQTQLETQDVLLSLGYLPTEIQQAFAQLPDLTVQDNADLLLKSSLRILATL